MPRRTPPPSQATAATVHAYDFRRPTTLAREHSRVLELAFETFARQWGTQLTANVRTRSQATFHQVNMHTYDEYAASLPASTTMVLCRIGDEAEKAVIQFPAVAALTWLSHMLGGTGEHREPERTFTEIEQQLVLALGDDLLDDLRYSLGRVLPADLEFDTIHHNAQFAQAASTSALMIVASFTVECGEQSAPATVAFPADVLLRGLGDANPVVATDRARSLVASQVSLTPVDFAVQLDPVPVTPRAVLDLAVGDLIPLRQPARTPFRVSVDGHVLGRAAVGRTGTRLACTIIDTLETAS
ncbi:flagellar motor switch protein FliM [Agromyces sp. G08B096]|uniref:Flagellar motor switch protein FliM n=1 Tax=Agromyces sp. G08B096 TaxID=3156399 RepID=A0AAU7W9X3_9MICO